jgi:hypothetical protein
MIEMGDRQQRLLMWVSLSAIVLFAHISLTEL